MYSKILPYDVTYWLRSCSFIFCINIIDKDFFSDVYNNLNLIESTKGTIYAFRVLYPHQWFLAKQHFQNLKSDAPKVQNQEEVMPKKFQNKLNPKRMV